MYETIITVQTYFYWTKRSK